MNGRTLMIGLLALAVIFGAGLWYAQVYAYYERVDGLAAVRIGGRDVAVSDYRGVDADTSPLKMRGCFRLDPAAVAAPPAPAPTPLIAPGWFDCFDAGAIGEALERGEARAVIAQADDAPGFDRIVAIFPDGRAYQWRQASDN
jgi:hypothetical protein